DAQPDDGAATQKQSRIAGGHVVLSDMHAVRFGCQRDVNAIVDQKRDIARLENCAQHTCFLDHYSGRTMLVAQLHESRTACNALREICERTATTHPRIDKRIKPQVDVHQLTFARSMSVGPSRS